MLKALGIIGFSALMAATVFVGILMLAETARAQVVPAQNQIIPSAYFGDGYLISTSTSPTHKLGAALIDLAGAFITGILGVPNGGTGSTTLTGILRGDGTNSIKTLLIGTGLSYDGTTLSSTGQPAGNYITALTGDVTATGPGSVAATLATVNANTGAWGSATQAPVITLNGKGLATAASNVTITPAVGSITGLGTNVATALGINVGTAGSFVVNGGALGTPSSGTLTNATGLPIIAGTTGTLTVARGGTGTTTAPSGQLLYGGGDGTYQSIATTTVTCAGTASCTTFTIPGVTPITITGSGGGSGGGNVSTSSAETATRVPFWTSTAGTPALLSGGESTFAYNATDNRLSVTYASTTGISTSYASSTLAFFGNASTSQLGVNDKIIYTADPDTGVNFAANTSSLIANNNIVHWNGSAWYPANSGSRDLGINSTNLWNRLFVNYASTTGISTSYASSTSAFFGSATIGSITGLLKGTAGLVSQAVAGTDYVAGGTGSTNQFTYFTGAGTIAGDTDFTLDAAVGRATFTYASTTALSSAHASSTDLRAGVLRINGIADGCLNIASGVVGGTGSACGSGGASFGQTWEINGSGFLAPTTTIDVFVPDKLRFDAANTYIEYNNPGFVFNTPDFISFGTGSAAGLTIDTTDGFFLNNNYGIRQREAGSTIRTILNIDTSDILTVGNSVLPTVIEGNAVTIPDVTNGTLYADSTGLLSPQTGTTGVCVEWGANGSLVDAASAAACGGGGGGGPQVFATTSPFSGLSIAYIPESNDVDVVFGDSTGATSTAKFWWDVSDSISYIGQIGSTDATTVYVPDGEATTTMGVDASANVFAISMTDVLGVLDSLLITSTSTVQTNTSSLANFVDDLAVRVGIATANYLGFGGLLDQFTVRGRINQEGWSQAFCDSSPSFQISADGQFCGQYWFAEDGTATLTSLSTTNSGYTYNQLATTIANDGAGVWLGGLNTGWITAATSTPILEVNARINTVQNATTTNFFIGFTNVNYSGTAIDTLPTAGCFFTASSTQANWRAVCRTALATGTYEDTGIASSSVTTGTGNFRRFRIELDSTTARFYVMTPSGTLVKTNEINHGLTTQNLNAGIHYARTQGTAAVNFDFFGLRTWWAQFTPAF